MSSLFFYGRIWYNPLKMDQEYLTRQEVMALLKVSRSILDELVRQGLPRVKFGRRVVFRRKDLDDFIQKHHLVK